jgi:DNA methyltransferase 1-associated protein 1
MRKKYILSLENRTPDQIAEEEALYVEVKRLEHTERKFKKDRENLLRTLAGIDSGLPDIVEDDGSVLGLNSESTSNIGSNKKKSQRKSGLAMDADSPATPSVASTPILKRPQNLKNAAYGKASCVQSFIFQTVFTDAQHFIIRTDVPSSGIATKAAHQPAYLRTFKIPVMKTAVQQKVQEAVAELGLSSSRLVIPTRENVAQLDATLEAMLALLETKRLVEKAEYDIQVLKKQLGLREQSAADGKGTISGMEGVHVDYAPKGGDVVGEIPGENERSQSVLSVRSARSRKHVSTDVSIHYSVPDYVLRSHDARCRFPRWTLSRQELARNDRNEAESDSWDNYCVVCTTIHIESKS